jgi:hypothetical protein
VFQRNGTQRHKGTKIRKEEEEEEEEDRSMIVLLPLLPPSASGLRVFVPLCSIL